MSNSFLGRWSFPWRSLVLCLAVASNAVAQTFPSKPIRLVVPFAPGGVVDTTARQLGPKLSEALGQPVLVENRSGAGGTLAADFVAKSAPDGHTLLVAFDSHAVNPHIYKADLRYDTFKDFAPISFIGSIPLLLERVFISLCSQLFGIEGREEVSDIFGGCYAWRPELEL